MLTNRLLPRKRRPFRAAIRMMRSKKKTQGPARPNRRKEPLHRLIEGVNCPGSPVMICSIAGALRSDISSARRGRAEVCATDGSRVRRSMLLYPRRVEPERLATPPPAFAPCADRGHASSSMLLRGTEQTCAAARPAITVRGTKSVGFFCSRRASASDILAVHAANAMLGSTLAAIAELRNKSVGPKHVTY